MIGNLISCLYYPQLWKNVLPEMGLGNTAHNSQLFGMSQMRLAKIKTHPPGAFPEEPLYAICFFFHDIFFAKWGHVG